MFSEEISSIRAALGVLAGRISEEDWALVKLARHNLEEVAMQVKEMENQLVISTQPQTGEDSHVTA